MPTMTEQEILDRFSSRLSAAKEVKAAAAASGVTVSTADALAALGAPIAAHALSTWTPPPAVTTTWEMGAGGIVELAPARAPTAAEIITSPGRKTSEQIYAEEAAAEEAAHYAAISAGKPPGGNTMGGLNQIGMMPGAGDSMPVVTAGIPAVGLAAGIPALLAALGITAPGWLAPVVGGIAGVAGAYGLSQAAGVQYPWETQAGQGFIAPWTSQGQDPVTGKYYATEGGQAVGGIGGGAAVVKTWTAGGWPFAMTSDGRIHTVTKNGVRKSWRPKKHIVLPRGSTTLSQAIKAQRYLDKLWHTAAKRTKALKLA